MPDADTIEALEVPENVRRVLTDFVRRAREVFGDDLLSVVLYGSAAAGQMRTTSDVNLLLVLRRLEFQAAEGLSDTLRLAEAAVRLKVMFLLESEAHGRVLRALLARKQYHSRRGPPSPKCECLRRSFEREAFDGIISLHTDATSDGVYGYTRDGGERIELLHEALEAPRHALPRCGAKLIDGFAATNAISRTWSPCFLSAPPDQEPRPWEIILGTPSKLPSSYSARLSSSPSR